MIRPTFLGFETAKRALTASQLGLDTVGHNISNINTAGYTRQRVDQVSISSSGYKTKYQAFGSFFPGQGSDVTGISQIRDPYLDRRYRAEATACGEYAAISNGLGDINAIFDEIMTTGSHAKMSEFLSALDKLLTNADSKEHATVLRTKAEQIIQVLNENSRHLDGVELQQQEELESVVGKVNLILEQIAMLNGKIKEDNFYGNPANELNDQRNLLIDQLSEYIAIDVKYTPFQVRENQFIQILSIEIKNSGYTDPGDPSKNIPPTVLVDSTQYNGLKMTVENGETHIKLVEGVSGNEIKKKNAPDSDITSDFLQGGIKGYLDILNGQGVHAKTGESSFRGIPYYRACLNDYAQQLARVMNEMNQLHVYDSSGSVYTIDRPLFTTTDIPPSPDWRDITAANLQVSAEWGKNPRYIENSQKHNALYTDSTGMLYTRDDDGNLVGTNIPYTSIVGVDKDGFLLIEDPANPLGNYTNTNGGFNIKVGGKVYDSTTLTPPITSAGLQFDSTGALLDSASNPVTVTLPDGSTVTLNKNNLQRLSTNWVDRNGNATSVPEDAVNLTDLVRAVTERSEVENPYYLPDYVDSTTFSGNGFRVKASDGNYYDTSDSTVVSPQINDTDVEVVNGKLVYSSTTTIVGATPGDEVKVTVTTGGGTETITLSFNNLKKISNTDARIYEVGDPAPNELIPGESANDNLIALKLALTSPVTFDNGFRGTFQEYLVHFQSEMASDQESTDALLEANYTVLAGLANTRDSISAVSLDEEGINMMTFQNYYNAAARYMTVLDEALGTVIQNMGIVGR